MAQILYIGGSESYVPSLAANSIQVMRMAGAWAALGHQVTLVVPHGHRHLPAATAGRLDPFAFYGIEHPFTLHRLRLPGARNRLGLLGCGLGARRLARQRQWDLVYCRHPMASIMLARGGVRHWFEAHHFRQRGQVDRLHLPILRSPLVERLVLLAENLRAPFTAAGVDPAKLLVAPDGVDLPAADGGADAAGMPADPDDRRRLRELGGITDEAPVAIYAGSLNRLKGTDLLLATARQLPAVRFVLLGGPDRAAIAHYRAAAADLPNLHLAGTVEPTAVPALLRAAELLLLPHARGAEQRYVSPLKLFEYMAAGRPIIASDLATTREVLVPEETALLVPPDDATALAAAIRRLLADNALARRLAGAARRAAGGHTWQARAGAILDARPSPRPPRRRVLHIINSFHPLVGGAERQAAALARCQSQAGDEVVVLTRHQTRGAALDGDGPVTVRRVGHQLLAGAGFLVAALAWLLPRRRQFDLVHAHQARLPAVIAAILRRHGGPPALVKLAGPDLPTGRGPITRVRRQALAHLDQVVATQPAMAGAARALGLERVELVPNGVDTTRFAPSPARPDRRRELGLTADQLAVLYVGRLEQVKGIDLLLAAWPAVVRACPAAHLWIAGDGTLGPQLRRRPPSQVDHLGAVDDPLPLYQAADLLVLPSRSEGLSNVLLECMATELAVVATRVGGNPQVIEDGKNGVLVPPVAPPALAAAIVELLADRSRRQALGAAARQTILARYRLAAVEEQWSALYDRLIATPR